MTNKHEHVTKEELILALLDSIDKKFAQHSPYCARRVPIIEQYGIVTPKPEDIKCNCDYAQWYLSTQEMLNRANR